MTDTVEILQGIMGCGKSESIFKWIDSNPNEKYIYVSPNLTEVGTTGRIHSSVSCRQGTTFKRPINQLDLIKQQPTKVIEAQQETALNTQQYYTLYEAKNEHITEDGAVFPTKELAELHQTNVSKGKGNAQIVLDYNGGYVLAEQIFLQEVKYNKECPYVNFIDVMNNNNGVVSNVQEEHCVFDNLGGLTRIMNIGLTEVIGLKTTQSQAVKIQEALDSYVEIEEKFNNSVLRLKSLVKQVK